MKKQITHCPFCGKEFQDRSGSADSRSASGYQCEDCNEMLEIKVGRFPLA